MHAGERTMVASMVLCGKVGDTCHLTKPCGSGLSCAPGVQRCYHSPRQEGEPCVAGYGCGGNLTCEAGSQVCRAPGKLGDACHATRPCGSGLSCAPGVQRCYHSPRQVGEPCVDPCLGRGAAQLGREADPDHERAPRHRLPEPARHRDQQDGLDDEPGGGRSSREQPRQALSGRHPDELREAAAARRANTTHATPRRVTIDSSANPLP